MATSAEHGVHRQSKYGKSAGAAPMQNQCTQGRGIHASAAFSLDGEMIEGSVPARQRKLVIAWMEIHHEDLLAKRSLLQEGQEFFRIAPLQ